MRNFETMSDVDLHEWLLRAVADRRDFTEVRLARAECERRERNKKSRLVVLDEGGQVSGCRVGVWPRPRTSTHYPKG